MTSTMMPPVAPAPEPERTSFACGMCGKCFADADKCMEHIRSHTANRSFRCLVCWPLFPDVIESEMSSSEVASSSNIGEGNHVEQAGEVESQGKSVQDGGGNDVVSVDHVPLVTKGPPREISRTQAEDQHITSAGVDKNLDGFSQTPTSSAQATDAIVANDFGKSGTVVVQQTKETEGGRETDDKTPAVRTRSHAVEDKEVMIVDENKTVEEAVNTNKQLLRQNPKSVITQTQTHKTKTAEKTSTTAIVHPKPSHLQILDDSGNQLEHGRRQKKQPHRIADSSPTLPTSPSVECTAEEETEYTQVSGAGPASWTVAAGNQKHTGENVTVIEATPLYHADDAPESSESDSITLTHADRNALDIEDAVQSLLALAQEQSADGSAAPSTSSSKGKSPIKLKGSNISIQQALGEKFELPKGIDSRKVVIQVKTNRKGPNFNNVIQFLKSIRPEDIVKNVTQVSGTALTATGPNSSIIRIDGTTWRAQTSGPSPLIGQTGGVSGAGKQVIISEKDTHIASSPASATTSVKLKVSSSNSQKNSVPSSSEKLSTSAGGQGMISVPKKTPPAVAKKSLTAAGTRPQVTVEIDPVKAVATPHAPVPYSHTRTPATYDVHKTQSGVIKVWRKLIPDENTSNSSVDQEMASSLPQKSTVTISSSKAPQFSNQSEKSFPAPQIPKRQMFSLLKTSTHSDAQKNPSPSPKKEPVSTPSESSKLSDHQQMSPSSPQIKSFSSSLIQTVHEKTPSPQKTPASSPTKSLPAHSHQSPNKIPVIRLKDVMSLSSPVKQAAVPSDVETDRVPSPQQSDSNPNSQAVVTGRRSVRSSATSPSQNTEKKKSPSRNNEATSISVSEETEDSPSTGSIVTRHRSSAGLDIRQSPRIANISPQKDKTAIGLKRKGRYLLDKTPVKRRILCSPEKGILNSPRPFKEKERMLSFVDLYPRKKTSLTLSQTLTTRARTRLQAKMNVSVSGNRARESVQLQSNRGRSMVNRPSRKTRSVKHLAVSESDVPLSSPVYSTVQEQGSMEESDIKARNNLPAPEKVTTQSNRISTDNVILSRMPSAPEKKRQGEDYDEGSPSGTKGKDDKNMRTKRKKRTGQKMAHKNLDTIQGRKTALTSNAKNKSVVARKNKSAAKNLEPSHGVTDRGDAQSTQLDDISEDRLSDDEDPGVEPFTDSLLENEGMHEIHRHLEYVEDELLETNREEESLSLGVREGATMQVARKTDTGDKTDSAVVPRAEAEQRLDSTLANVTTETDEAEDTQAPVTSETNDAVKSTASKRTYKKTREEESLLVMNVELGLLFDMSEVTTKRRTRSFGPRGSPKQASSGSDKPAPKKGPRPGVSQRTPQSAKTGKLLASSRIASLRKGVRASSARAGSSTSTTPTPRAWSRSPSRRSNSKAAGVQDMDDLYDQSIGWEDVDVTPMLPKIPSLKGRGVQSSLRVKMPFMRMSQIRKQQKLRKQAIRSARVMKVAQRTREGRPDLKAVSAVTLNRKALEDIRTRREPFRLMPKDIKAANVLAEINSQTSAATTEAVAAVAAASAARAVTVGNAWNDGTIKIRNISTGICPWRYVCKECGATYRTKMGLLNHSRLHASSKRHYSCDICGRVFSRSHSVRLHRMIHTRESAVDCTICGKTLANDGNLQLHMRIHTGEKPHKCKLCHKTFRQSSSLQAHMRMHTGEKPFVCEYCGKAYSFQKSLYTHRFSHTGQKPYICKICGRGFPQVTGLNVHIRSHTGERPYKCPLCPARFTQKSHIAKHHRYKHEPRVFPPGKIEADLAKPYRCDVCNRGFNSSFSRGRHMRSYCNGKYWTDVVDP